MNITRQNQRGIALILTLILLVVMSVMAISLTFISKTETWSSMNYRSMSQARDAAEAGINNTANYLMYSYTPPSSFSSYNISAYPVQSSGYSSGHDIILSASSVSSNYPDSAVQSDFNTAGKGRGSLTAGNITVNYATSARLLSMQSLIPFGSTTAQTVQAWEITSSGSIPGVQSATEQVTAILERNVIPTFRYAAFATDTGCSALQFGGGGTTDSYASGGAMSGGRPVTAASDGNVGTNGNLSTNGNPTTINGTLSTPRTGVGTCSTNNVTAWTASNGTVTGGLVQLPQTVVYPTPTIPPPGSIDIDSKSSCPAALVTAGTCSTASGDMVLNPDGAGGACASSHTCSMSLRNINMNGNKDLHLKAGTYNIDSLTQSGNTRLILDSTPVVINVTGSAGGTVFNLTGGGVQNPSPTFDPTSFQILYAGTGTVNLKGGGTATGLLYAPNATFSFAGNSDWYGAVIGKIMTDLGGTAVHYDRKLKDKAYTIGPYMLSSFTWNKY